ncbi:hypothetical protein [Pararobbsia alpina]|uniref:hypothetical protein n=1 Tax=Pararobbsia alpina TaxID=621374 RepID=UPI0039A5B5DA
MGDSLGDIVLVWYFPLLVLQWPTCGTLKGLLKQFREKLVSEIRDPRDVAPIFRKMRGENAESAVIAAMVLLNVGMVAIDGASANSLKGQVRDILAFLCRLQAHTNVPVLLSCTDMFMHGAKLLGSEVDAVLRGHRLEFKPFSPPNPKAPGTGTWGTYNKWFWQAGLLPPLLEMPRNLPIWTSELCHGRVSWLSAGFRALLERLVWEPKLLESGGPSEQAVKETFEQQLCTWAGARTTIAEYGEDPAFVSRANALRYVDHLPFAAGSAMEALSSRPLLGVGHA